MAGRVIPTLRTFRARQAIDLTPSAVNRIKFLMQKRETEGEKPLGIRLGVKKRGCNGLSYTLDYATQIKPKEELVEQQGVKVFIEPQALMSVVGTTMDFVEDRLKSEFVFLNPNAKSACGCGESFSLEK